MTHKRLRECPFCGGEASKRLFYKGKYRVHCNVCDAHSGDVCDTEAEAIAAWNTRAVNDLPECTFELDGVGDGKLWRACSACGGYVSADYDQPRYCPHCGAKAVLS